MDAASKEIGLAEEERDENVEKNVGEEVDISPGQAKKVFLKLPKERVHSGHTLTKVLGGSAFWVSA